MQEPDFDDLVKEEFELNDEFYEMFKSIAREYGLDTAIELCCEDKEKD